MCVCVCGGALVSRTLTDTRSNSEREGERRGVRPVRWLQLFDDRAEGGRGRRKEEERDQSCSCRLQRASPLHNIPITGPTHYLTGGNEDETISGTSRGPIL